MAEAGWEHTIENQRRDLFFQTCFTLVLKEGASTRDTNPVRVIVPREDRCGSCGRHLFTLFDLDLADPRLAFLGLDGERLRIAMCPTCTPLGDHVFTDVDMHGSSQWSFTNGEDPVEPLEDIEDWEDFPQLPFDSLQLGRTAYETHGAYWQKGLSQLGGFPEWVQTADYPPLPQM